jgi:DNA processing protein
MDVSTLLALALGAVPVSSIKKLAQLPDLPLLDNPAAWQRLPIEANHLNSVFSADTQRRVDAALAWAEKSDQHLLHWGHSAYPPLLMETALPPPVLMVKGNVQLLKQPQLAIVGSRHPTPSGVEDAQFFARALSEAGLTISSGLAMGIDAAAHSGALQGQAKTIAVLGCGIDVIYPKKNARLYAQIAEQGALVSEFSLGTAPLATFFPRRNRIVSGMSLGALVVEAALKSGSLITARYALEQNREVFAIPGQINQTQKEGCHYLIRQGATLIENPLQILEHLNMNHGLVQSVVAGAVNSLARQHPLHGYLDAQPASVDLLVRRSGLDAAQIMSLLMELELDGVVMQHQGEYRLA